MNFHKLYNELKIELRIVAVTHHEANEVIERANWTLQMTCIRPQPSIGHLPLQDFVLKAAYEKNFIRGSRLASEFKLLYAV